MVIISASWIMVIRRLRLCFAVVCFIQNLL